MALEYALLGKLADALSAPEDSEIADLVEEVSRTFTEDEVESLAQAIALNLAFGNDAEFTPEQQAASDKLNGLIRLRRTHHSGALPVDEADESEDALWFEDGD